MQVAFSDNFPNITKRVEKAINNCTFRDKIALARALVSVSLRRNLFKACCMN